MLHSRASKIPNTYNKFNKRPVGTGSYRLAVKVWKSRTGAKVYRFYLRKERPK